MAEALKKTSWKPIVISRSEKLLAFARSSDIQHIQGWWWSQQNWSGKYALLFPLYLIWQGILTVYYFALILHYKPSVIHLQSKDDFIAGSIAGYLCRVRVVWTDHADLKHVWLNIGKPLKNPVGKLVFACAHLASTITVVSESEKKLVLQHLPKNSSVQGRIHVVYNGAFDQMSLYPRNSHRGIVFIMASRLVVDKGVREAIDAFIKLRKNHADVQLMILGDGPHKKQFISSKGAKHINFIGHTDNPFPYFASSDIFIHPTYHEGFSVALVEASMMGLPIIATDVGGNPEIIHDDTTGVLIPPKDSDALYDAMGYLVENKNKRELLGKHARKQFLDTFEFQSIVQNYFVPIYGGDR